MPIWLKNRVIICHGDREHFSWLWFIQIEIGTVSWFLLGILIFVRSLHCYCCHVGRSVGPSVCLSVGRNLPKTLNCTLITRMELVMGSTHYSKKNTLTHSQKLAQQWKSWFVFATKITMKTKGNDRKWRVKCWNGERSWAYSHWIFHCVWPNALRHAKRNELL